MLFGKLKARLPSKSEAPVGREEALKVAPTHYVNGNELIPPFPEGLEMASFGLGCFWGAEKMFWEMPGVYSTQVGYCGGFTKNPHYQEVCNGYTGHVEVVRIVFNPEKVSYMELLAAFWQKHDPTQYLRQGNDVGTQYRSVIYAYNDVQKQHAEDSKLLYQQNMTAAGFGDIVTEILPVPTFYYAEDYHQQYLAKNANGYCGLGGTGVKFASVSNAVT